MRADGQKNKNADDDDDDDHPNTIVLAKKTDKFILDQVSFLVGSLQL